jgi:hypothetical protein
LIEDLEKNIRTTFGGLAIQGARGKYALFKMEVMEDEFALVCACLNGRFIDVLDLRIRRGRERGNRRNARDTS